MVIKESGLYALVAAFLCAMVVAFIIIYKGYQDKWILVSAVIVFMVGIICSVIAFKKQGKILFYLDRDKIVIRGSKFDINSIEKVATSYRGFNSDSPREIFFTTIEGAVLKVDVSYVRESPIRLCDRINEYLGSSREEN